MPGAIRPGRSGRWLYSGQGASPGARTLERLESAALGTIFVAYLFAVRGAGHVPPGSVIAVLVAAHVMLFLAPPLQYTDVLHYIKTTGA